MCLLWTATPVHATEYTALSLHQSVEASDVVVLARVVDPQRAAVQVDRVLKGDTANRITLTGYIDGFLAREQQKPLVQDARELMFLTKRESRYAPLQTQYGRWTVVGRRVEALQGTRNLAETLASIQRLVAVQARAARGGRDADDAYLAGMRHRDPNVREWALDTVYHRIKVPSTALPDALLAYWPAEVGIVANAMVEWRLHRAAPLFARTLTSSSDGDQRAYAAMALGGTGDETYLPLLRRVASTDPYPVARSLALSGIVEMIGPAAFDDLRAGARDADTKVRAQAVVDSYNMLELETPDADSRRRRTRSSRRFRHSCPKCGQIRSVSSATTRDRCWATSRSIERRRHRGPVNSVPESTKQSGLPNGSCR